MAVNSGLKSLLATTLKVVLGRLTVESVIAFTCDCCRLFRKLETEVQPAGERP